MEFEIKPKVETDGAESGIEKLSKAIDKLSETLEKTLKEQADLNKNVTDSAEKTEAQLKATEKATSGLAKGFKGVGLAIKAAGIGLVIGALNTLKDVFMQNQEVADTVATAFETVSIVFNDIVGALVDTVREVSEATNGFEALGKVVGGIITLSITPLKAAFFGVKLGIQEAQLAWEQSVLGDNDPETVKNLTSAINETKESLKEVGTDAAQATKDLVDNFSGAIDELGQVAAGTTEKVKEISIEAAIETAQTNTELKNSAQLAAAQQQRLIEQYDRQAEKLRQTRDLESNSLQTRVAANEELAKVLDEQEKALLKQADSQIAAAQAAVNVNDTIENRVALSEALANKEGILAQIEGFRSEQQSNINSLTREANQLTQTQIEGEQERARQIREFQAEQIEDEALRIEKLRENIAIEQEILLADFERKKELYAEGTQARIDAEQEYYNKKQELELKDKELEKKQADASVKIEEKKEAAKAGLIQQGFKLAGEIAGKNAAAQKGVAAAEATFSTYAAIAAQLKSAAASPGGAIPGYAIAQAIATGAFGFAQVAKILSTPTESASAPSIGGGGGGGASVPETPTNEPNIPNFDFINQGVGGGQDVGLNRNVVILQEIKDREAERQAIDDIGSLA